MEAFAILGFVFGLVAFVRIEKLIKTLKEKKVLETNYKEEWANYLQYFVTVNKTVTTRLAN